MKRVVQIPERVYRAGSRGFGPVPLPDGVTRLTARVARCTAATPTVWPDASSTLSIELEASFDGGQTWVSGGAFSAMGGIHVRHDGTQAAESSATWEYPQASGRMLRGQVVVTGANARTTVIVEIE